MPLILNESKYSRCLGDEMISSRLLLTYDKGRDGLFKSFKCLTKEFTHKHLQKKVFVIIEVRFYYERGLSNGCYLL